MCRLLDLIKYWLPGLMAGSFLFAVVCAKARDPNKRIEFSLKTATGGHVKGIAILPKPPAKHAVVIYAHGAGGSMLSSGKVLRQIAEVGLAAVAIEYDQTDQSVFDEQFIALISYINQQPWAQTNAVGWVGFSLGAQRMLRFALTHFEYQPQLMVRMAGGWVKELDARFKLQKSIPGGSGSMEEARDLTLDAPLKRGGVADNHRSLRLLCCPVLLVHGDKDQVFGVRDCYRLAKLLRADGTHVETRILPEVSHNFDSEHGMVSRAVAEYCVARLPLTDYTGGCRLSPTEAQRFNAAMQRAGKHRRELWRAVTSSREPERHTVMTIICGLEDYDLAHITSKQLRQSVYDAWKARRTYAWCRDTPLDIFEKFTANARIYEEPLEKLRLPFAPKFFPRVKYCHSVSEASNATWVWMRRWARFRPNAEPLPEARPREMYKVGSNCKQRVVVYNYYARSVGLAARPVYMLWPGRGDFHWSTEVWSAEEKQWHAIDCSANDRNYSFPWLLNVAKASMLASNGERGGWNALAEQRWDAFTNTIGLFYPSGHIVVRVMDKGKPIEGERVQAQIWLKNEVYSVAVVRTDARGEARLTLGQSAIHPYRISLDRPDGTDWQWLAVQAKQTYNLTLNIDNPKPFNRLVSPPALKFQK